MVQRLCFESNEVGDVEGAVNKRGQHPRLESAQLQHPPI